jgi:O-succinylbenzoic acid--CoA ligase
MKIDWDGSQTRILLNPAYPLEKQQLYLQLLALSKHWDAHFWLSTSGSTSQKWVALSKQAILASAESVNQHLQVTSKDRWVTTLPNFHVGGLGIWARAYLSQSEVFDFKKNQKDKWNAKAFVTFLDHVKGTLTALVPAQIHDFVQLGIPAPKTLRAAIIGGGKLTPHVYQKGIELGWPLMPSYGLTECASQVATAPLECWKEAHYPSLKVLNHIAVRVHECLEFKGPSLLSYYAHFNDEKIVLEDPKKEGWFQSSDRGELIGNFLNVKGRIDHYLKIGGESIDLSHLEAYFESILLKNCLIGKASLISWPDERLGHVLNVVVESEYQEALQSCIDFYQQTVLPFEKVRKIFPISRIPRSPLGKMLKNELIQELKDENIIK